MYHVVLVEDDPMVTMLNRSFLEKDGRFQVEREFQDGRSALTYLSHNAVDLVILDIYMPVLTGLELLRELRRRGVATDVIPVTAANDTQTVDVLLKLGVVDYLVKPFTYPRFHQALDTFCRHRETMSAEVLDQSALDQILYASHSRGSIPPPKGLQEKTLDTIRSCLRSAGAEGHTSESLAAQAGVSAVTARRYVNFLVEQGEAESQINYDTGGRPSLRYTLKRPR